MSKYVHTGAVPAGVCACLRDLIRGNQDRATHSEAIRLGAERSRVDITVPEKVMDAVQAAARHATGCATACVSAIAHCYFTTGPGDVMVHHDRRMMHNCSRKELSTHTLLLYCNTTTSGSTWLVDDDFEVVPVEGTVLVMPAGLWHGARPFKASPECPEKIVALFRVWTTCE
jgi:hypothetical protein